jgi:hypothetical protein
VQDRLREWKPSVIAKLKIFACMAIQALDLNAIRIDLRLAQSGMLPADSSIQPHSLPPSQAINQKLAALNGLKLSVWTFCGGGLVLAYDGGILLPMLRNTIRIIRPKLAWLVPADENIWFHRQVHCGPMAVHPCSRCLSLAVASG